MSETVLLKQIANSNGGALALIVTRTGSAPRGVGAMLLLESDGRCAGTVGGGRLEQQIQEELQQLQHHGRAAVRSFKFLPEKDGMPCGGSVQLVLAPLSADLKLACADAADSLLQGGSCRLHIQLTNDGGISWGVTAAEPAAEAQQFNVPLHPAPRLLICGAGHIAQALVPMALNAGFMLSVLDDRSELLKNTGFASAVETILVPSFADCLAAQALTPTNLLLIATYAHQHDQCLLEQAVASAVGYIGMVGSRRKREELFAALQDTGVSADLLSRVRCPVGLAIGAETPAEIAVSILAEMIAFTRGRL